MWKFYNMNFSWGAFSSGVFWVYVISIELHSSFWFVFLALLQTIFLSFHICFQLVWYSRYTLTTSITKYKNLHSLYPFIRTILGAFDVFDVLGSRPCRVRMARESHAIPLHCMLWLQVKKSFKRYSFPCLEVKKYLLVSIILV